MRIDHNLAFMLQFENVAWYENGEVKILDRIIYPMETKYVVCKTYQKVVQAIKDMVTQSGGPYLAASMAMVLAADNARGLEGEPLDSFMKQAAYDITNARPTTSSRMKKIADDAYEIFKTKTWENHDDLVQALFDFSIDEVSNRYARIEKIGIQLADKLPKDGTIMTQCFAETVIGMICRRLKDTGNTNAKFICPETRPYLQGARLTASVICDMGFDVHVITDNMPAYILKEKNVDLFTSASDMITMDGYVVNKVGTFQIALACHYHKIPYFVTGSPSQSHPTIDTVEIEERNHEEVLEHLGKKATMQGVKAYYPAFDATPPTLCSGVITEKGIYSPFDLASYFKD